MSHFFSGNYWEKLYSTKVHTNLNFNQRLGACTFCRVSLLVLSPPPPNNFRDSRSSQKHKVRCWRRSWHQKSHLALINWTFQGKNLVDNCQSSKPHRNPYHSWQKVSQKSFFVSFITVWDARKTLSYDVDGSECRSIATRLFHVLTCIDFAPHMATPQLIVELQVSFVYTKGGHLMLFCMPDHKCSSNVL